jgi:hypothetical protein
MGGQTGDRSRKTPFLRKVIPHRTIDSSDFGQAPKMHQTPQGQKKQLEIVDIPNHKAI